MPIIECKTEGKEHNDAWKKMLQNSGQLFSYVQQAKSTQFVCLYSSDFVDGNVVYKNQIITLKDNEKLLEENADKKPLSYKDAQEVEDIFKTWKETYKQDFASRGIFENDIPAYHIGKHKFSLNDLEIVSSKDIQGKYHEFATILRQHNVSGRENAFDKLVSLFLCKIVDETQNPGELKFYWKGIAYDSYFELQDRLQLLYQAGMKEFLGEEVTYIDNAAIDEAFRFFKNDPDATRATIKKYFRELKFFTNNDFAFIDVHNEKLFYQNATVLLKIVQMLQDIRLKTDEQNQFLGDMFEGFLDQGVKQSEGQFFTPMPIVKFIIASLPLESIIKDSEQVPKVIDYACGAGHFLNEYALQIDPYAAKHNKTDITEYYPEIVGIEKEYRLSKVAKVSAFMYGQDDIKIIYGDALSENSNVKDGKFSVLVSNPPFSVKGFLETLSETDRNTFGLIDTIDEKSLSNNNSIEAFFIERAKQLLKPDGVAGIIVPSSILSKGSSKNTSKKQNVYVATREIILKYFDIVAIAKFGSGTFGKTETNTATLFLKRKKDNPAPADHYKNRVKAWFENDTSKNGVFADEHLIKEYCNHLEYSFDDYKTLLEGSPNDNILNADVFKEYHKDFDKSTEVKNCKKQKNFKALSRDEQKVELDKKNLKYLQNIEIDKLYHFVLASLNPREVVIVKTPTDNTDKKKFLGYEWSSAKGNEGIKYIGGQTIAPSDISTDDDEANTSLEEEDVRVLSNILNLNNIQTPLYDPKNLENAEKINSIISANFNGKTITIPKELKEHVSTAKLVDMLDFSRKEFNKEISISPRKNVISDTQWELKTVQSVADVKGGKRVPKGSPLLDDKTDYPYIRVSDFENGTVNVKNLKYIAKSVFDQIKNYTISTDDVYISIAGTIGVVGLVPHELNNKSLTENAAKLVIKDSKVVLKEYLSLIFTIDFLKEQIENATKSLGVPKLALSRIEAFRIPLPPPDVQKQIVQVCEAVDKDFENATKEIEMATKDIENKVNELFSYGVYKKLQDIVDINKESFNPTTKPENDFIYVDIDSVGKGTGIINYTQVIKGKNAPSRARRIAPQNSILVSTVRPYLKGFAYVDKDTEGCVFSTGFVILESKNENIISNKALYYAFMYSKSLMQQMEETMPKSAYPSINKSDIENYSLSIPDINIQKTAIKYIEQYEEIIKKAQAVIGSMPERKQEVIKKYL